MPKSTRLVVSLLAIVFLFATMSADRSVPCAAADCEEDLAQVRTELNATRARLADVEEERDEFADRLEDSTMVLIITLILLIGSYFVFFFSAKRQRIVLNELERRAGVTLGPEDPKGRKRRRG